MTLTQYSRHRRTSLLPLAPAPKRPCPTPQYGSLLQRRASQSAPPAILVIAPCASPRSDPRLRRDVRISSSSGSVRRASLTRRALFQMAPKWLAKTKYGAKPKPKATAPPPSPSPSPSHAAEARASAPVPACAPADRGAAHCAPQKAPATQPGAPEAPQSAPVPALASADKGAPHSAPPKAMAPQPRAPEALHSAPVPALAPADRGARPSAPPQASPQPPPGGVDFVIRPWAPCTTAVDS